MTYAATPLYRRLFRPWLLVVLALAIAVGMYASAASSTTADGPAGDGSENPEATSVPGVEPTAMIEVPLDKVLFGSPGEIRSVAEVPVDEATVGTVCAMELEADNQSSVHPGNNLIVDTGADVVIVSGVEDAAADHSELSVDVELGSTIVIQLQFGSDGVASFGYALHFFCPSPSLTEVEVPMVVDRVVPAEDDEQTERITADPPVEDRSAETPSAPVEPAPAESAVVEPAQLDPAPVAQAVDADPDYTG